MIISATNKGKTGLKFDYQIFGDKTFTSEEGYFKFKNQGKVYLATSYTVKNPGWTIMNTVPLDELLKENTMIQQVVFTAMIISFAICIFIAVLFSNRIFRRLKNLYRMMGKLGNEDFDVYVEPTGNDEVTLLCRNFNKMSGKLKELILKVYSVQINKRKLNSRRSRVRSIPIFYIIRLIIFTGWGGWKKPLRHASL